MPTSFQKGGFNRAQGGAEAFQKVSKITLGGAREGSEQKDRQKNVPPLETIMQQAPKLDPEIVRLVEF